MRVADVHRSFRTRWPVVVLRFGAVPEAVVDELPAVRGTVLNEVRKRPLSVQRIVQLVNTSPHLRRNIAGHNIFPTALLRGAGPENEHTPIYAAQQQLLLLLLDFEDSPRQAIPIIIQRKPDDQRADPPELPLPTKDTLGERKRAEQASPSGFFALPDAKPS